jgi:DNA-binding cell septation regulator SpoVG
MSDFEVLQIKLIEGKNQLRAFVNILINGVLTINGIRIMEDAKGYWIGYPQSTFQTHGRTQYIPVVESSESFKQELKGVLLKAFEEHKK